MTDILIVLAFSLGFMLAVILVALIVILGLAKLTKVLDGSAWE